MSEDFASWLARPPLERLDAARTADAEKMLRKHLDEETVDSYMELARHHGSRVADRHLTAPPEHHIVLVPGVMGSLLHSNALGGVWWIDALHLSHLDRLALAPDGLQDVDARSGIDAFTMDTTYESFVVGVTQDDRFSVSNCPYDWRKPLGTQVARFADHVEVAAEKVGGPVHIVAHSMGGLLVRLALACSADPLWSAVGKVIFVGTPHFGSPAIAGYLKHHFWGWEMLALLGKFLSRSTFRTMWGPLSLLPAPIGTYPGTESALSYDEHPCLNFDPYDACSWKLGLGAEETDALQMSLDSAARQHMTLAQAHAALPQERRDRMAMIAGVGYETLFRLAYRSGSLAWREMEKVKKRDKGDRHREGDGRVPLASAELSSLATTRYVKGIHGRLLGMGEVQRDVIHFISGEPMRLANTPAAALAQHLGAVEDRGEDPGYLRFDVDDQAAMGRRLAMLAEAASAGRLLGIANARIL